VASPVARFFGTAFASGCRVLDVGAGSGRDLAALLSLGYDAYGAEPMEAMATALPAALLAGSDGSLPSPTSQILPLPSPFSRPSQCNTAIAGLVHDEMNWTTYVTCTNIAAIDLTKQVLL
jgi:SAM-dependent methyltransferase